ncbi:MAG: hypothetical protein ACPGVG_13270 [Mycobacterium sp.]
MAFTDDFNRANEDLEDSADWTLADGSAGALTIVSNEVNSPGTNTGYHCPDQGDDDHYAQAKLVKTGANNWLCVRQDGWRNWYGIRASGTALQIYRRTNGSFSSSLGSWSGLAAGDVLKIEAEGTTIKAYVNGVERISITDSTHTTGRQGLTAYSGTGAVWDDFEAGVVGGGGGSSAPVLYHHRQMLAL